MVVGPNKTPLARMAVIRVVSTTGSHNEGGVAVAGESIGEDGFVLTVDV